MHENYFPTKDYLTLKFHAEHSSSGLICVLGLQGSGKSALLRNLAHALPHAHFFRWEENWEENLPFPEGTRTLLVDLPDYPKGAGTQMGKDLSAIADFWLKSPYLLIVAVQKEMFEKYKHFFLGKSQLFALKPLTTDELIAAYKLKWKDTAPFTPEALNRIAQLSRGIFRRFLRYMMICIQASALSACDAPYPITVEIVNRTISLESLCEDMNLELSEVFGNNRESKMLAVEILTLLQNTKMNQTTIAATLETSEATVSRIVNRLRTYGYLKRERGQHGEWLLSLA